MVFGSSVYGFDISENGRAGAGMYRGGAGVLHEYRILSDKADISSFFGRGKTAPWGIDGGSDGSCNVIDVLDQSGKHKASFSRTSRYPLKKGDLVQLRTGHGGGWGNPKQRDKQKIQSDIDNGYISKQSAQEIYSYGE